MDIYKCCFCVFLYFTSVVDFNSTGNDVKSGIENYVKNFSGSDVKTVKEAISKNGFENGFKNGTGCNVKNCT